MIKNFKLPTVVLKSIINEDLYFSSEEEAEKYLIEHQDEVVKKVEENKYGS